MVIAGLIFGNEHKCHPNDIVIKK